MIMLAQPLLVSFFILPLSAQAKEIDSLRAQIEFKNASIQAVHTRLEEGRTALLLSF
jgi:hypothetical protein